MNRDRPHEHFADRLLAACREKGAPVCVGLDPVYERLPAPLRAADTQDAGLRVEAIEDFCRQVIEVVAPLVPCVKIQAACFERYFWPGFAAYHRLIEHARNAGLLVIADAKRGDIGVSAAHYAAGFLTPTAGFLTPAAGSVGPAAGEGSGPLRGADALTVNGYFGADALEPFIEQAATQGRGLFVLVRTSNPGSAAIQSLKLADGRAVVDAMAAMVAEAGKAATLRGRGGYSLLGAVVGATCAADAARLRKLMPQQIFLVPGFGAQGGDAADVAACFKADGTGAIVTASRSILYAYEQKQGDWRDAVREATVAMKDRIKT